MLDSDFWRELAVSFRSVPDSYEFTASRLYFMELSTAEPIWSLPAPPEALSEFDVMARRGARMLISAPSGDLAKAWLEALWKEATHGSVRKGIEIIGKDRSGRLTNLRGNIDRVFQASYALCRKFESAALQTEFEEKQRNDPKSWSALRQEFEALRQFTNLLAGPRETITEQFVREAIARHSGIKPEEVTPMQIRFEVSGLLREYPITYLPTAQQQSPAPESKPNDSTESKPTRAAPIDETIAAQIERLRDECRWTNEDLAEAANLSTRQVVRHVSGESVPYKRNIAAYERVFTKQLKRQIVLDKMS